GRRRRLVLRHPKKGTEWTTPGAPRIRRAYGPVNTETGNDGPSCWLKPSTNPLPKFAERPSGTVVDGTATANSAVRWKRPAASPDRTRTVLPRATSRYAMRGNPEPSVVSTTPRP